ncbi:MAG: hypothetical protein WCF28_00805 [Methanobacterium sp.]|uniref:hypothetical protein n=1 Tax=Methanobacterium sp. TaxID=2164 RepID=UPI003C75561A
MVKSSIKLIGSVLILLIVVFSVDYLFFRNQFWPRLSINIGIFLIYVMIYYKYSSKE